MNFEYLLNVPQKVSTRLEALKYGLNRPTLRALRSDDANPEVSTLSRIAEARGEEIYIGFYPAADNNLSRFSVPAVSLLASQESFDTWRIHFFDFVDAFRNARDLRLISLPPVPELDVRRTALLASMVCHLCCELKIPIPPWARKSFFLSSPWFLSGMESLKASALLESPLSFRRNNIYVLENFMQRI